MSNALALAATTAVMRQMLQARFNTAGLAQLGNVTVTALPPDKVATGGNEINSLNIFLYQVTPNGALRNRDLPTRDGSGTVVTERPVLAVDLHYMISAYGSQELAPEVILGFGLQVFHETPVLSPSLIRQVFAGAPPGMMALLAGSGLDEQAELVHVTPQLLTTEELSKLWTGFQDKYRVTAALLASVVLIESAITPQVGPPVRLPLLTVLPLPTPVITGVDPQLVAIAPGAAVALLGNELLATGMQVQFNDLPPVSPDPGSTSTRLAVTLPAGLQPGPNLVRVVQLLDLGAPPLPHSAGVSSNSALLMVQPSIKKVPATNQDDITLAGNTLTVRIDPQLGRSQRASVLLNATTGAVRAAYAVDALPRDQDPNPTSDTVQFPLPPGVHAGTYLVRVRVDGADSVLRSNATGLYVGPTVTI